jgi:Sulfotransferase family
MDAPTHAVPPADSTLFSADGENMVLLLGAPRSGTTWLAKILDSHPDVVYRHEPDTVLRNDALPYLCPREGVNEFRDSARQYLMQLTDVRTLKSAGSLPLFEKRFRSALNGRLRTSLIYALHAAGQISRGARWPRRVSIPDLMRKTLPVHPTLVLKSVGSRGRIRLFGEALPKSRIGFILRHPCGQVASTLHGMKTGRFERSETFKSVLVLEEARTFALTPAHFASLSPVQQCAWHWALLNQKALNDLGSLARDRVMLLRYEDACAEPMRWAKELVNFAGLAWNSQTAAFIQSSTNGGDNEKFYGTNRDPLAAANRWRNSLTESEQRQILEIAASVPVGQMFVETAAQ